MLLGIYAISFLINNLSDRLKKILSFIAYSAAAIPPKQTLSPRAALKQEQARVSTGNQQVTDLSFLKTGLKVKHPTFGVGVVKEVTPEVISVAFEKVGEKRLSSAFLSKGKYLDVVS